MSEVITQIYKEIEDFKEGITVIGEWKFNQLDRIKKNILYYNSKYEMGEFDDDGFKVYFYNIIRPACGTTTKSIDIDTKDIIFLTAPGGEQLKTWFKNRDFRNWSKKKLFDKVLNTISERLPKEGTVLLKKVGDDIVDVNLKNFMCEQNADCLDDSNYKTEIHYYTRSKFKKLGKKNGWKNIDKLLDLYGASKDQYIRVYERYGEVEEKGEDVYKRVYCADIPTDIANNESVRETALQLTELQSVNFKEEDLPYIEFHFEKIAGRWLGVSIPEILEDPQVRMNEIVNQRAKNSYWASLRLFQSKDTGIARNLLKGADTGDVLEVQDQISAVPLEDRNGYSYYDSEMGQWKSNTEQNTFSYDVVRGDRTPAGTPLGSAQLSVSMAMSYFEQIRENIGIQVKFMLYKFILPMFKEYASKDHIVRIMGEDLDKLVEIIVNTKMRAKILDYINTNALYPSEEEIQMMREMITDKEKQDFEKHAFIPSNFYGNEEDEIDIVITGENIDSRVKAANLTIALQMLSVNPGVLQDPVQKAIFAQYLEQGGLSIADIEAKVPKSAPVQQLTPNMPVGGGVSAPGQGITQTTTEQIL